jgi:hypothetical protein
MAVSTTKFNALAFFFTILLGFFLVGCNHSSSEYTISFIDENVDTVGSITRQKGNVNITAIAEELGISLPIYTAKGAEVNKGNIYYENYKLTKNTCFYLSLFEVHEAASQADLAAINNGGADALSGKYVLTEDIELDGVTGFDDNGWIPIGVDNNNFFNGTFNGNNHTIKGLWVDRSSEFVGLFGFTRNAQIKNLIVEGEVKGKGNVGSIVGYAANSNISDSHSIGSANGDYRVGGIAGTLQGSSVTNSYSTANISATADDAGGIAGLVFYSSTIANSYSNGSVDGTEHNVGGIAGRVIDSSITNSYSTGDVHADYTNVGGIAGSVIGSSVTNSYSIGNISGNQNQVGGIAGNLQNAIIRNNAAINPSVAAAVPYFNGINGLNRVVGYVESGALPLTGDNFALDSMLVIANDIELIGAEDELSGTSKDIDAFKDQATYEILGWGFAGDDSSPWVIDGGLPYLYWENR